MSKPSESTASGPEPAPARPARTRSTGMSRWTSLRATPTRPSGPIHMTAGPIRWRPTRPATSCDRAAPGRRAQARRTRARTRRPYGPRSPSARSSIA